jgi:hypothetical protein
MPLAMLCATCLQYWLVSVLGAIHQWWSFPPFFAFIDSHYGPMGGAVKLLIVWGVMVAAMRNHVVQLGVLVCRTAVP